MKLLLVAFLVLLGTTHCIAQDAAANAQLEAQKSADAMLAGDYEKLVAYTPRQWVAAMGGKEAMVAIIKQGMDGMKAQAITFQSVRVGDPGPIQKIGGELISLVPQKVTLKVPGGHMESEAYLIGISEDGGKTWVFADSTGFTKENEAKLAQIFPELSGKLHIHEHKEPVFKVD